MNIAFTMPPHLEVVEPKILHVGSGSHPLPDCLTGNETRLDIDPATGPDIVADMTDMGDIGTYDVVFCHHALEHLYPHDVGKALCEFHRVLRPGGAAVVFVPDLEDARPTDEVLFVSPSGPIAGLDLFYGFRERLRDEPYMAHHTGFVAGTLKNAFQGAGFTKVATQRLEWFNLMGFGVRP